MLLLSRAKHEISEQTVHNVQITVLIFQFLVKMYRTRIYQYFTTFCTRVYTHSRTQLQHHAWEDPVSLQASVVLIEEYNVMVNSEELTLWRRNFLLNFSTPCI